MMVRSVLMVCISLLLLGIGHSAAQSEIERVYYLIDAPGEISAVALNADGTLSDLGVVGGLGDRWAGMRSHYRIDGENVLAYIATESDSDFYHLSLDGVRTFEPLTPDVISMTNIRELAIAAYRYPYLAILPMPESFDIDTVAPFILNVETMQFVTFLREIDVFQAQFAVRFAEDAPLVRYAERENIDGGFSNGGTAVDRVLEFNLETGESRVIYQAEITEEFMGFFGNTDGSQWVQDRDLQGLPLLINLDGEALPIETNSLLERDLVFGSMYSDIAVALSNNCMLDCPNAIILPGEIDPIELPLPALGDFFGLVDLWPVSDGGILGTDAGADTYVALVSADDNLFAWQFYRVSPDGEPEFLGLIPETLIEQGDPFSTDGRYALIFEEFGSPILNFVDTYTGEILLSNTVRLQEGTLPYSFTSFANGFAFTTFGESGPSAYVFHYGSRTLTELAAPYEVIDILPGDRFVVATIGEIIVFDAQNNQLTAIAATGTPIISREPETFLLYTES